MQAKAEEYDRELWLLAEHTDRVAGEITDTSISQRLREIAEDIRRLARQQRGGSHSRTATGSCRELA